MYIAARHHVHCSSNRLGQGFSCHNHTSQPSHLLAA